MLSAFIVFAVCVGLIIYISNKRHTRLLIKNVKTLNTGLLITASMVLGIGAGGFIDGIVFHQILQWHEMLSDKIPPVTLETKSVNMFWDGIFHMFTLIVFIIGITLLWKLLYRKNID